MKLLSLIGVLFAVSIALAEAPATPAVQNEPCHTIIQTCKAQGFRRRGMEGKRLFVNCLKPILNGQTVQGVNVDAATIQACQARRARRRRH